MRTILLDAHKNHPGIAGLVQGRLYQSGSLGKGGIPSKPDRPWMSFRQMPSITHRIVEETSHAEHQFYQIWFYDDLGSMLNIDNLVRFSREAIKGIVTPCQATNGFWLIDTRWLGASSDFTDEEQDAGVRFATVRLTSSG